MLTKKEIAEKKKKQSDAQNDFILRQGLKGLVKKTWWWPEEQVDKYLNLNTKVLLKHERSLEK